MLLSCVFSPGHVTFAFWASGLTIPPKRRVFLQNFLQPLKEGSKSHIISEQERNVLFSDIETILALNKMFLVQVENRLRFYTNKTLIADIFLSFVRFQFHFSIISPH